MTKQSRILSFVVVIAVLLLCSQSILADTRIALVIGNGAYSATPLDSSARDADLMAETLRFLDFDVTLAKDVDQRTMKRLIAGFGDRLREVSDTIAFFYYSGHGMQVSGRNYMIPVDAEINDEADVEVDGVPAWSVLTQMEYASTSMNIVVLDACRNNPFEKRFKSLQEGTGLAPMEAPAGTLVAYATAPGDVADPGPIGGYSTFTAALTSELRRSSAPVLQLFNDVSAHVYHETGHDQRPYLETSAVPPLALRQAELLAADPAMRVPPTEDPGSISEDSPDLQVWSLIKDSNDPTDLETFVETFPDSIWAPFARNRLAKVAGDGLPQALALLPDDAAREIVPSPVQPAVGVYREPLAPESAFRDCPECPEMVVVPAGSFLMGGPKDELGVAASEVPQHQVTIAEPFAVSKYETSFAEWDACVQDGGCAYNPEDLWGRDRQPVIKVSWNDVVTEYLPWLSRRTGRSYRLLSEAEWEYAARAGTTTPFAFGSTIATDQANYNGTYSYGISPKGPYRERTVEVGALPANAWGLHQMHGNVSELVADCKNFGYKGAPVDGSVWGPLGGCIVIVRGGSWRDLPRNLRSAHRDAANPGGRTAYIGFRVARAID